MPEKCTERADREDILNNLTLARQFALTTVKLQMFGAKHVMPVTLLEPVFFVSCPRLDATDCITRTLLEEALSLAFLEIRLEMRRRLF